MAITDLQLLVTSVSDHYYKVQPRSDMDFYSTLGFEFAGCSVITFSPSKAPGMHGYHRNARVTPSLNPSLAPV